MSYVIVFLIGMLVGIAVVTWAIIIEGRTPKRPGYIDDTRRPW